MKLHLDGEEIAKAIKEYLARKGHKTERFGLFSEEAETNEGQPTFWAVVEVKTKKKNEGRDD